MCLLGPRGNALTSLALKFSLPCMLGMNCAGCEGRIYPAFEELLGLDSQPLGTSDCIKPALSCFASVGPSVPVSARSGGFNLFNPLALQSHP